MGGAPAYVFESERQKNHENESMSWKMMHGNRAAMKAAVLVREAVGPHRLPGTHQPHGRAAVQRLVLRLLIPAQHDGLHLGDKNQGLWEAQSKAQTECTRYPLYERDRQAAR